MNIDNEKLKITYGYTLFDGGMFHENKVSRHRRKATNNRAVVQARYGHLMVFPVTFCFKCLSPTN